MLAAVFAWAAASKIVRARRWRRALTAYGFPAPLERVAAWAVPASESLVPLLVVAGLPRAAAVWSVVLLVVFSGALVRASRRWAVAFHADASGDAAIDRRERSALARNAVLLAVAAFVFVPGLGLAGRSRGRAAPGAGDVLPFLLTLGALTASALVAWRASVWLARGSA